MMNQGGQENAWMPAKGKRHRYELFSTDVLALPVQLTLETARKRWPGVEIGRSQIADHSCGNTYQPPVPWEQEADVMGMNTPWVSNLAVNPDGSHNAYQTHYTFIGNPAGIYGLVVRLNGNGRGGSGILIGPDLVLTAAHVVTDLGGAGAITVTTAAEVPLALKVQS
jgi:hypothetical protein